MSLYLKWVVKLIFLEKSMQYLCWSWAGLQLSYTGAWRVLKGGGM